MTYVQGFVAAVPADKKDAYIAHTRQAAELFLEWGATRCMENWGDFVPVGKLTDFQRAVQAKDNEVIVFSWVEYPDKATCEAATDKMMTDPRMENMEMPFDAARMIYGGFDTVLDLGK